MNEFYLQLNGKEFKFNTYAENRIFSCNTDFIFEMLRTENDKHFTVRINDKIKNITLIKKEENLYTFFIDGKYIDLTYLTKEEKLLNTIGISKKSEQHKSDIKSPMPGMVLKILKREGDTVEIGEQVIILEAMKMENIIKSTFSGVIKEIYVKENIAVEKGVKLFRIE